MSVFYVTTESGARYRIDTDARTWRSYSRRSGPDGGALHKMSVIDREAEVPDGEEVSIFSYPAVDRPEVGKSIFVWGGHLTDWRLSTKVVKVEEFDAENEAYYTVASESPEHFE